ncbi:uncharacterized protein LOC135389921 [Ornithodoros turicata]|uniref:uncharacterized protein LOC135389921 n=1 Tax=Ornithodoros turicata TaxID=34597 RepID=UPI003138B2D6
MAHHGHQQQQAQRNEKVPGSLQGSGQTNSDAVAQASYPVLSEAAHTGSQGESTGFVAVPTVAQGVHVDSEKAEPAAAESGYGGGGYGGGHSGGYGGGHGGGHGGGYGGGGGGGGGDGHGEYFQFVRVPGYDTYEFGYRKGNPHHFQERHESRHGPHFRTKQRWGDKHGGYGEHYWEYNHAPKHEYHDEHGDGH